MSDAAGHTFSSLQCEHGDLQRVFEKHQRASISKDVPVALATIVTFESNLKRHIAFEEDVLLPLYKSKGGEVEGGTSPIFQAEHRKLRETAARLAQHTDELYTTPDMLGTILNLLDEEALFKGLMAHHTLREQNLLFPRLDAITTEREREKMLEDHFA
jgi:regulator of cell morphogenesis and NO signaling